MRRPGTAALVAAAVLSAVAVLAGCTAPADLDGELVAAAAGAGAGSGAGSGAGPGPAATRMPGAPMAPVAVDTDLGADDLVALAFLLRHREVDVRAVTIAATGLVGCEPGVDLVAGLFSALAVPPVPVACGRAEPGAGGRAFPQEWRAAAAGGSGVAPVAGSSVSEPAADLLAEQARDVPGLVLVAIGPMTNVADLATRHPEEYARLAGIHAMAGSVAGPVVDGVAEWNAAADPAALAAVLASSVPLTLVPEDAVPTGTPDVLLGAPVLGRVAATADVPAWWDLAAVAALVAPDAGSVEEAAWALDPSAPGRLRPAGAGIVRVVRTLDPAELEAQYARALAGSATRSVS